MPRDLTFSHPYFGLLLLAIPFILLLFLYVKRKRRSLLDQLAARSLLMQIAELRDPLRSLIRLSLFLLFWFFGTLALMAPIGNEHFQNQNEQGFAQQDVIFLIDASFSMAAKDTPNQSSRFDYAKEIADLVIKKLKGSDVMLVTFTTSANLIAPQTHDTAFLRIRLKDLDMNESISAPGTNFLESLTELKKIYSFDPRTVPQVLVLFSDGGDTAIEDLPAAQKNAVKAKILNVIDPKHFPHLKIYSIGMGTLAGGTLPRELSAGKTIVTKLDPSLLEALSDKTGGQYFAANAYNAEALANLIVEKIEQQRVVLSEKRLVSASVYDEYFQIPLVLSLIALLGFLVFPTVNRSLLGLCLLAYCQIADGAEDFMAKQLFEAGEYAQAFSRYQELLATTAAPYQPLIYYNLGTILLAEGKAEQAINLLEAIPYAEGVSLNLKRRAFINIAVAYKTLHGDSNDLMAKIFYLKKAYQALLRADAIECPEGDCIPQEDFNALKIALTAAFNVLPESTLEPVDQLALAWDLKAGPNQAYPVASLPSAEAAPSDLLAALDRLYSFEQSKALIASLQQKALGAFPALEAAQNNLDLSQKAQGPLANFFFQNAALDFRKVFLEKTETAIHAALLSLIAEAKGVVQKQFLFLDHPEVLAEEKTTLSAAKMAVLEGIRNLPKVIYQWQQNRFKQGICQCKPWNEVLPLLRKGNDQWRDAEKLPLNYQKIMGQKNAIQTWLQAFEVMKKTPEGPEEATNQISQQLNELQKMQQLDKQLLPKQKIPQGGKFW